MAKYTHPKILLIDCMSDVETRFRDVGFDVATGTFGGTIPWGAPDEIAKVNGGLPFDFAERRVVIVDMDPAAVAAQPKGQKQPVAFNRTAFIYRRDFAETVDTRPLFMRMKRKIFDRTLEFGGVIVCFVAPRTRIAAVEIEDGKFRDEQIMYSWDFLSALHADVLHVGTAQGSQIIMPKATEKSPVSGILKRHLEGAHYSCCFQMNPKRGWQFNLTPILANPNGQIIGAILTPKASQTRATGTEDATIEGAGGFIFLLPQLNKKPEFLVWLLTEELPVYLPGLFPDFAGEAWVHRTEYEHGPVIERQERIQLIQQEAVTRVEGINAEITQIQRECKFLSDLLTEQNDALVDAVEEALHRLGFRDVVNLDDEIAAGREEGKRREDLRIGDREPELLVEVKGLTGTGADEDSLSAYKYVAPRMRERGHTKVRALSILNHQRHLPPLDRSSNPFRELVLENAQKLDFGLMTTWDLFRLTRSFIEYGWHYNDVSDVFYQSGRIDPVPKHYQFVGEIGKTFEREGKFILGVEVKEGEIRQGDTIAIELRHKCEEQKVESMRIRKNDVEVAIPGDQVGIACPLPRSLFANGFRVFRVRPSA